MSIDVQPSMQSGFVLLAIVLFVLIGSYTSGALLTLVILLVILAVTFYLIWVSGVRVTRYLTGK